MMVKVLSDWRELCGQTRLRQEHCQVRGISWSVIWTGQSQTEEHWDDDYHIITNGRGYSRFYFDQREGWQLDMRTVGVARLLRPTARQRRDVERGDGGGTWSKAASATAAGSSFPTVAAPSAARASPASPVALVWAGRGCCGGLLYNATVAGVISYGRIASLSGVSVQDLFLWFPVRGIHVDVPSSGPIYFDVGVVPAPAHGEGGGRRSAGVSELRAAATVGKEVDAAALLHVPLLSPPPPLPPKPAELVDPPAHEIPRSGRPLLGLFLLVGSIWSSSTLNPLTERIKIPRRQEHQ
uniref:Uncharacterized protein n=1 Tax=Oryza meridionalis TaxID=40149 RepID=A0A0E0FBZ4_9ORYZ